MQFPLNWSIINYLVNILKVPRNCAEFSHGCFFQSESFSISSCSTNKSVVEWAEKLNIDFNASKH